MVDTGRSLNALSYLRLRREVNISVRLGSLNVPLMPEKSLGLATHVFARDRRSSTNFAMPHSPYASFMKMECALIRLGTLHMPPA